MSSGLLELFCSTENYFLDGQKSLVLGSVAMKANGHISAQQAADILGKSKRRINQLVAEGELVAQRIGNMNVIERASVEKYAAKHQPRSNGDRGQ